MVIDANTVLDTMGTFTWFWGKDWFVETELGNFHWSDPDYDGDNTFTLFKGGYDDFRMKMGVQYGRDKGTNLIRNKCGASITLIKPS